MFAHRFLEHVGLLALCTANGLGVLSCNDGHERMSSLEALLPWRCSRVMLPKSLSEVGIAVVGLLLLEMALVICVGRSQMY